MISRKPIEGERSEKHAAKQTSCVRAYRRRGAEGQGKGLLSVAVPLSICTHLVIMSTDSHSQPIANNISSSMRKLKVIRAGLIVHGTGTEGAASTTESTASGTRLVECDGRAPPACIIAQSLSCL